MSKPPAKNPRAVLSVYKLPDHQVQVNEAGAHRAGVLLFKRQISSFLNGIHGMTLRVSRTAIALACTSSLVLKKSRVEQHRRTRRKFYISAKHTASHKASVSVCKNSLKLRRLAR